MTIKKSICLFSSFYVQEQMPYYIKFYLLELQRHFDAMVFITSNPPISAEDQFFLKSHGIDLELVSNEGYDFGMWYKTLKKLDLTAFNRIGLVNDSCILFNKLDPFFEWAGQNKLDFFGMMDSKELSYHIQSYFIVMNEKAIRPVCDYFMRHGIYSDMADIIEHYEIGLSTCLAEKGLQIGAYFDHKKYSKKKNPAFFSIKELIAAGFPLIKKKIMFHAYRDEEFKTLSCSNFNFNSGYYRGLIQKHNPNTTLDRNLLFKEFKAAQKPLYRLTVKKYYFLISHLIFRTKAYLYSKLHFTKAFFKHAS